jgi:CRISPR type IV-associated protein Csf2
MNKINLKILATNVTPLCQSESSDTFNGVPTTFIKKKEEVVDGKIGTYPYYSANGFRGQMHREIADVVMKKALEKGIPVSASTFHMLAAGGGSNYQAQPIAVELAVRELNPIASVFGLSLAVAGKLMVSDLIPIDKHYRVKEGSDTMRSKLINFETYTKKDELLNGAKTKYGRILSEEDIAIYNEDNDDVQEARKNARETKSNEKVVKHSIQSFNQREWIITGTEFEAFIGSKDDFTDIEKGMLLVGLEAMMSKQLGGIVSKGFGIMEYNITTEVEDGNRDVMGASKNSNNLYAPNVVTQYDANDKKCIAAFNEWLENIEEDNIVLGNTLLKPKK